MDKADLHEELRRSNAWRTSKVLPLPVGEPHHRRITDRDPEQVDADQYARRILRLANSAQTAIYNIIRAFEEVSGLLTGRREQ